MHVTARQLRGLLGPTPLDTPAYASLAERIRLLIVDGRIALGARLPSERELAITLQVSRTTVVSAYAVLRERGFATSRVGAGSFASTPHPLAVSSYLPGALVTAGGELGLSCATSAAPPGVAAAYARAAERLPSLLAGTGYLPDGLDLLRERLAEWFSARGAPTDPRQIVVTAGALSAINIVLGTLTSPGDRVLLESPTYSNAIEAARRARARLVAQPAGAPIRDYAATLAASNPKLAYLIPDFHNPTGRWLDEESRGELARALRRGQTVPVVDETLVELRLDGDSPRTPLAALVPRAITIGSASKAYWGGFRIGWIRAPEELVVPLVETRATLDLGAAPFEQLVVAELMSDPENALTLHRERLRAQREVFLAALARRLPDWQISRPAGGAVLWAELPREGSSGLVELAAARGVLLTPGHRFFVNGGGDRHLRLPFTLPAATLETAAWRLGELWAAYQAGTRETVGERSRLTA